MTRPRAGLGWYVADLRNGCGSHASHVSIKRQRQRATAAVFFFQRCGVAASSTARVHHNGGAQPCTNCSSYRCALPCGGHRAAKQKESDAARANHNESDAHLQCSVATGDAQIDARWSSVIGWGRAPGLLCSKPGVSVLIPRRATTCEIEESNGGASFPSPRDSESASSTACPPRCGNACHMKTLC